MLENKWIIFDLDGTLADIEDRRIYSMNEYTNKINWDMFFDPKYIHMDKPNKPVIMMAQALTAFGYKIAILSGRSKGTQLTTKSWLVKHKVPFHILKMRPEKNFTPDEELKLQWFGEFDKNEIVAVFDDRDKVVKMWRENGLTCFQVAEGKF